MLELQSDDSDEEWPSGREPDQIELAARDATAEESAANHAEVAGEGLQEGPGVRLQEQPEEQSEEDAEARLGDTDGRPRNDEERLTAVDMRTADAETRPAAAAAWSEAEITRPMDVEVRPLRFTEVDEIVVEASSDSDSEIAVEASSDSDSEIAVASSDSYSSSDARE